MDEKVLKGLLVHSISDVFEKMMASKVAEDLSGEDLSFDHVEHYSAAIGFAGKWNGFVSVQSSKELAFQITAKLLFMDVDQLEKDDVRDAMGEMVNMIGGKFKSLFAEMYTDGVEAFKMSIPSVIVGRNFHVYAVHSDSILNMVVLSNGKRFAVKLALKKILK